MNKTTAEAVALAKEIVEKAKGLKCKIAICPVFTVLSEVNKVVQGTNVLLGAQNMSDKVSGAFTGEISPDMLKDVGVSVVILGHSERRSQYTCHHQVEPTLCEAIETDAVDGSHPE